MLTQKRGERVALFVDGDNLYGTLTALGWSVDFVKLKDLLCADCQVYNSFYYTSWDEDQRKKSFSIFLLNQGFTVRKREMQKITKNGREVCVKGDTDILMVMDLLLTRKNWDIAVLVTGDGDFVPTIEYLRFEGKRIIAVSSKFESASIELVNSADRFIDLAEIRELIQRVPSPTVKSEKIVREEIKGSEPKESDADE